MRVIKGDVLGHHSVPGPYHVLDVMHDGRVVLLDPRGERQRVRPDYLADNFRMVIRRERTCPHGVGEGQVCGFCG